MKTTDRPNLAALGLAGLSIVGRARVDVEGGEEPGRCECCGREIVRLVFVGRPARWPAQPEIVATMGWACAAKIWTSTKLHGARELARPITA